MTENKRFTITQDFEEHHRQIRDDGYIIMGCFVEPQAEVIVDLLNQLNDENEELKKENKQVQRYVYHCPQFCKRILAYLGKCGNEDVEAVNNAMDIDEYFDEEIDNLRL